MNGCCHRAQTLRMPTQNNVGPVVLCREVAFSVELTDLDGWGSWEDSLLESSSLGGDCTPLRGAFIDSVVPPGFKNLLRGKLYQLCRIADTLAAVISRWPGPFWSAEMAHSFAAANTYSWSRSPAHVLQAVSAPSTRSAVMNSGCTDLLSDYNRNSDSEEALVRAPDLATADKCGHPPSHFMPHEGEVTPGNP